MNLIDALPTYTLVLPVLLVAGAWALSKILRFSLWITLIVGCVPFVLPYLELPFSQEFLDAHPLYLILGGWALLLAFALGRAVVLPLLGDRGRSPAGFAKAAYGVVLGAALLVVALLVSKPEMMEATFPGWKGGAGLVLLCASFLAMSLWLARVLKAAIVFSVWSIVSLVLASELFLNKLPHNVVREDLRHLKPLASRFGLEDTLKQIETFTPTATGAGNEGEISSRLRAYVLGGSPNTGYLFPSERSFAKSLQGVLERRGVAVDVKDAALSDGSSIQLHDIAAKQLAPSKPDIVFIVGWSADAVRGRNSYGIPGLSEASARAYVEGVRSLHRYPFAADVVESVLYRYASDMVAKDAERLPLEELPFRVSPDEYKAQLLSTIKVLNESGSQVVLVPEPVHSNSDRDYRSAMESVAVESKSVFVPVDEALGSPETGADGRLFARGNLLSQRGFERVSEIISTTLAGSLLKNAPSVASEGIAVDSSVVSTTEVGGRPLPVVGPPLEPLLRDEASLLVEPSQVKGDLIFRLKVAEQGTRFYRVVFSVNGEFVADRRLDSREETRVRFSLPDAAKKYSLVELTLRTIASPPTSEDLVGTTEFHVPTPLQVVSDLSGVSMVKVGRRAYFARSRGAGAVAVSVDMRSGDLINVLRSEDINELNRWILNQPWGSVVALSLQTAQGGDLSPLRAGLKFIGAGNAQISEGGSSTAIIGITGTRKGEASIKTSPQGIAQVALGSEVLKAYSKFTLFDVRLGDREFSRAASPNPVVVNQPSPEGSNVVSNAPAQDAQPVKPAELQEDQAAPQS